MRTDKGDYHSAGPCGCEGSAQIVKATTRGQVSVWKLAFRPPLLALKPFDYFLKLNCRKVIIRQRNRPDVR